MGRIFANPKPLALLAAILLLPAAMKAQENPDPPKHAILHRVFDKKFLFLTALSVGTSIAATITISRCRRDHGIGPCTDGGYGEFNARETLRQVQTGFLILPSWKIKKTEDENGTKHKLWWIFEAGNAALNAGVIAQNARKYYGPRDRD